MPILEIKNLHVSIETQQGRVYAVRSVDMGIMPGEIVDILGESGAGKSMTMRAVTGLLPADARIDEGDVLFDGQSLLGRTEEEMMCIRGTEIACVTQNPTSSLNPIITVGKQMTDALMAKKKAAKIAAKIQLREVEKLHGVKLVGVSLANAKKKIEQLDGADRIEKLLVVYHRKYTKAELKAECIRMLERVGIDQPQLRYDQYPIELSGGQRQRVEIARALIVDPCCLIADEPVSDLDASVQADVINLFDQIRRDRGITIIFITHDISIVQYLVDRVGVLYKGRLVELADKNEIFRNPVHDYTKCLFASAPSLDIRESLQVLSEVAFDETAQYEFTEIGNSHFVLTPRL